jgi:hypothetical protein
MRREYSSGSAMLYMLSQSTLDRPTSWELWDCNKNPGLLLRRKYVAMDPLLSRFLLVCMSGGRDFRAAASAPLRMFTSKVTFVVCSI